MEAIDGWSKQKMAVYLGTIATDHTGNFKSQLLVPKRLRRHQDARSSNKRNASTFSNDELNLLLARIHKHLISNRRDVHRIFNFFGVDPQSPLSSQEVEIVEALAAHPGELPMSTIVKDIVSKIALDLVSSGENIKGSFEKMGIAEDSIIPVDLFIIWLEKSGFQGLLSSEESEAFSEYIHISECGAVRTASIINMFQKAVLDIQQKKNATEDSPPPKEQGSTTEIGAGRKRPQTTALSISEEQIAKVVDFLDPNNDGEVDMAELEKAFRILHADEAVIKNQLQNKSIKDQQRDKMKFEDNSKETDSVADGESVHADANGTPGTSGTVPRFEATKESQNQPKNQITQSELDAAIYFINPKKAEAMCKEASNESQDMRELTFVELQDAFLRARRDGQSISDEMTLKLQQYALLVKAAFSKENSDDIAADLKDSNHSKWFQNLLDSHAILEDVSESSAEEEPERIISELELLKAMEEAADLTDAERQQLELQKAPKKKPHYGVPLPLLKRELDSFLSSASDSAMTSNLIDSIKSNDGFDHSVVTLEEFNSIFQSAHHEQQLATGRSVLYKLEKRMRQYGQRLKDLFNEIDTSGDERLNYDEVAEMINKMNQPSPKARAQAKREEEKRMQRLAQVRAKKARKQALESRRKAAAESGAADVLHYLEAKMRKRGDRMVDLFRDLDTTGDGLISREELRAGLKRFALPSPRTLAIEKMEQEALEREAEMLKLQRQKEEAMRKKVFEAEESGAASVLAAIDYQIQKGAKIDLIFQQIDILKTGHISAEGLQMGLQLMNIDLPFSQVKLLVSFMDEDGDGTLDLIEFDRALYTFRQLKLDYPFLGNKKPPILTQDKINAVAGAIHGLNANGVREKLSQAWDLYLQKKAKDAQSVMHDQDSDQQYTAAALSGFGTGGSRMPSNWEKMTEKQKLQVEIRRAKESNARRQKGEAHWKRWLATKIKEKATREPTSQQQNEECKQTGRTLSSREISLLLATIFVDSDRDQVTFERVLEVMDTTSPCQDVAQLEHAQTCSDFDIENAIEEAFGSILDSVGQVTAEVIDAFFLLHGGSKNGAQNKSQGLNRIITRFASLYNNSAGSPKFKWSHVLVRSGCRFSKQGIPRDKLLEYMKKILQRDPRDSTWDQVHEIVLKIESIAKQSGQQSNFRSKLQDFYSSLGLSKDALVGKDNIKKWIESLAADTNETKRRESTKMNAAEKEAAFEAWCKERGKLVAKKKAQERMYLKSLEQAREQERQELYDRVRKKLEKAKQKKAKNFASDGSFTAGSFTSITTSMSSQRKKQLDIAMASVAVSPYGVHPGQRYKKSQLQLSSKIQAMKHDPTASVDMLPGDLVNQGLKAREDLFKEPIFYRQSYSAAASLEPIRTKEGKPGARHKSKKHKKTKTPPPPKDAYSSSLHQPCPAEVLPSSGEEMAGTDNAQGDFGHQSANIPASVVSPSAHQLQKEDMHEDSEQEKHTDASGTEEDCCDAPKSETEANNNSNAHSFNNEVVDGAAREEGHLVAGEGASYDVGTSEKNVVNTAEALSKKNEDTTEQKDEEASSHEHENRTVEEDEDEDEYGQSSHFGSDAEEDDMNPTNHGKSQFPVVTHDEGFGGMDLDAATQNLPVEEYYASDDDYDDDSDEDNDDKSKNSQEKVREGSLGMNYSSNQEQENRIAGSGRDEVKGPWYEDGQ